MKFAGKQLPEIMSQVPFDDGDMSDDSTGSKSDESIDFPTGSEIIKPTDYKPTPTKRPAPTTETPTDDAKPQVKRSKPDPPSAQSDGGDSKSPIVIEEADPTPPASNTDMLSEIEKLKKDNNKLKIDLRLALNAQEELEGQVKDARETSNNTSFRMRRIIGDNNQAKEKRDKTVKKILRRVVALYSKANNEDADCIDKFLGTLKSQSQISKQYNDHLMKARDMASTALKRVNTLMKGISKLESGISVIHNNHLENTDAIKKAIGENDTGSTYSDAIEHVQDKITDPKLSLDDIMSSIKLCVDEVTK